MSTQKVDRRVQRTRQVMRDALVALMLEKSYEKITIQEIIDRANVGRATFYNHYQDKDDLLLRGVAEIAYDEHEQEPPLALNHEAAEKPQIDTISTIGMFEHVRQNQLIHKVMFKRNRENPILEKLTAFLYSRIEGELLQLAETEDATRVPMPIMAQFIAGGLLSLIQWWHDHDFPYTAEEMDAFFQQIGMPGILNGLQEEEFKR